MVEVTTAQAATGRVASPWWIVVGMAAAMGVSAPAIASYALGVFLKSVVIDFGWTRGGASTALSLYVAGLAISLPVCGMLIDRYGARWPTMTSSALFALSLAGAATAGGTTAFTLCLFLAGLFAGGATTVPYVVTIAARFDNRRGLAMGLGAAGVGFGGAMLPYFAQSFAAHGDWRDGFLGLALIIPLVSIPAAFLTLNPRPASAAKLANGRSTVAPWRTRAFWLIAIPVALTTVGIGGVTLHLVPMLTDRGVPSAQAAATLSAMAIAALAGRILGGYLMDRFHAPFVASGFFVLAAAAFALIVASTSLVTITIGLVCLGLTAGSEADAISYLSARYLKLPGLGNAAGLLIMIFTGANALGVAAMGYTFDAFGSYAIGLAISIMCALAAAVIVARLGPYPESSAPGVGTISSNANTSSV